MAHTFRWIGHACFEITLETGETILVDPFLEENPVADTEPEEADIVLITHDHFDHMENIGELTGEEGTVVGQPEVLAKVQENNPELTEDNLLNGGLGMNIGGTVTVGDIDITMVQAFHSSDVGSPAAYLITTPSNEVFYHAGDTGIFGGMKELGELYDIDVAMLPIGSVFTMDPKQAALATKILQPEVVIPMHYGTFGILVPDTDEYEELIAEQAPGVDIVAISPGESCEY